MCDVSHVKFQISKMIKRKQQSIPWEYPRTVTSPCRRHGLGKYLRTGRGGRGCPTDYNTRFLWYGVNGSPLLAGDCFNSRTVWTYPVSCKLGLWTGVGPDVFPNRRQDCLMFILGLVCGPDLFRQYLYFKTPLPHHNTQLIVNEQRSREFFPNINSSLCWPVLWWLRSNSLLSMSPGHRTILSLKLLPLTLRSSSIPYPTLFQPVRLSKMTCLNFGNFQRAPRWVSYYTSNCSFLPWPISL